ncbi:MAG TPA: DNA lyase [Anaerolineae bacterium]|nr:DNA lyase [Anaerolineae bacterium]
MRIWTLHPQYLDSKGLVALWREALLARAVLRGETRGYRNHPQLIRFRAQPDPLAEIESYLAAVHEESLQRGYRFDATKLSPTRSPETIPETRGQLLFEWAHLLRKLAVRDPDRRNQLQDLEIPDPHPLFTIIAGPVREWEKGR